MRYLKILVAAIFAIAALTSIAATTASAALPEFLPGKEGETFTVKGGAGTLATATKPAIECTSDQGTGIFTGTTKKEALITLDVLGCKILGIVNGHSLGDKAGVILVHVEAKICYINKVNKEVGFEAHVLPIHIEISGKLWEIIGWAIGKITPVNVRSKVFTITYKQSSAGVQEIKKCEGGTEETLLFSENGGAFEKLSLVSTLELENFTTEQELMA